MKAIEIVDTLETLDMDEKVPELMRRRRGQDNFDQRKYRCIIPLRRRILLTEINFECSIRATSSTAA